MTLNLKDIDLVKNVIRLDKIFRKEVQMPKFSWKKATGLSKIKSDFARKTGIPTTSSGRKRKVKRMATGGGCIFIILAGIVITIIIFILK